MNELISLGILCGIALRVFIALMALFGLALLLQLCYLAIMHHRDMQPKTRYYRMGVRL